MPSPKFSIIIPIYNVEKFVARAIESAINQSYKDIEIICIDDKSTDESVCVIKEFMTKDERIKLICNDRNLGTFATRNKGVLSAKGEYLLFLDADDILVLNACERIENELKRYEKNGQSIEILAFNYIQKESKQDKQQSRILYSQNALFSIKDFVLEITKRGVGNYWTLWGKSFARTTYAQSLHNLNLNKRLLMAEDAFNFINVLFYVKNYACMNESLYIYCENESSITKKNDIEKLKLSIENHHYIIDTLLEESKKFPYFERYLAQIFCIGLQISSINEKRKLKKSFLTYLSTSLQKRFLRFKQRYFMGKISFCNKT